MKAKGILFLIGILFISCNYTENELIGIYTPKDYKKTFDTIQLEKNNVYYRKVYDVDKKLVLEMKGKWTLDNNFVKFKSFYLNLDDDLVTFPESAQDTTGGWGGDLAKSKGIIEFCVGHLSASLPDQSCYKKLQSP